MSDIAQAANTDRELWREREGDYYAPSLFVTEGGGIGINVGGLVYVGPIREWHSAMRAMDNAPPRPAPSPAGAMEYSATGDDERLFKNNLARARACPEIYRFGVSREHMLWLGAEIEHLRAALEESVKLQSHYATLLNTWDGGARLTFDNAAAWLARLAALTPGGGTQT